MTVVKYQVGSIRVRHGSMGAVATSWRLATSRGRRRHLPRWVNLPARQGGDARSFPVPPALYTISAVSRPSQPLIDKEQVVLTALRIIDESGLEAFGLEALARKLGVRAPSLYHHFDGKADILARVARLVTFEAEVPADPGPGHLEDFFVNLATSFRRAILRHPNAAPLVLQYYPRRHTLSTYERAAGLMLEAGVPEHLHVMILEGLDKLTLGSALFAAKWAMGDSSFFPGVDPERDPQLIRAIDANPWKEEDLFEETIRGFLRGTMTEGAPERPAGRRARRPAR